jgi:hypothetical protein
MPAASARLLVAASRVDLPMPASHEQRHAVLGNSVDQLIEHSQLGLAAEDVVPGSAAVRGDRRR